MSRGGTGGGDRPDAEPTWWSGSFLGSLGADTRRALFEGGATRRYPAGVTLMEQGAPPDGVVIIVTGRVKVTARGEDGRTRVLAFRDAGDIVGELGTLDGGSRSATIVAVSPVVGLRIATSRFQSFIAAHADASGALTRTVMAKLRMATASRVSFDSQPVLTRVARRLLDQADFDGLERPDGTLIKLTQSNLAELTGAAKPSVEKALRELREPERSTALRRNGVGSAPVIRTVGGKVVILRHDVLERLAGF